MAAVAAPTVATAASAPARPDGRALLSNELDKTPVSITDIMVHVARAWKRAAPRQIAASRGDGRGLARARVHVLGLDDHPAGTLSEQVRSRRTDALLARRSVDRRPIDHVRAHAFGF